MEAIQKLFMGLLVQRVQATWDAPKSQMGGYKGSQELMRCFSPPRSWRSSPSRALRTFGFLRTLRRRLTVSTGKSVGSMTSPSAYAELGILLHGIHGLMLGATLMIALWSSNPGICSENSSPIYGPFQCPKDSLVFHAVCLASRPRSYILFAVLHPGMPLGT